MSGTIQFRDLVEGDDGLSVERPPRPEYIRTTHPVDSAPPTPRSGEQTPLRDQQALLADKHAGLRKLVVTFTAGSLVVTVALLVQIAIGGPEIPPHGGVASTAAQCSDMGLGILKKGGSAVDAAITTMLCIGVVNPQLAGLGGGGFMVVHHHKTHDGILFDFRETAPSSAGTNNAELLQLKRKAGVPGELRGMWEAHKEFGKLEWHELFAPVIALAENGFEITKAFMECIDRRRFFYNNSEVFEDYLKQFSAKYLEGKAPSETDPIKRLDLAKVFRRVAKEGPDAFYTGPIALEIVKATDNWISLEDLKNYTVTRPSMIMGNFKDFEIGTFPAPGSGSLLIYILNIMAEYKVDSTWKSSDEKLADYYEKLAIATRMAAAERYRLGDPAFSPGIRDAEKTLISQLYAANKINQKASNTESDAKEHNQMRRNIGQFDDHGTSHISVIDADDLMVSVTHTLNHWFGSLVETPSGILLNDELDDFDNTQINKIQPGKRPLSSMVPTVVYHKDRPCLQRFVVGGINGTRILTGVASVISHVLGLGVDLKDALAMPRVHCYYDIKGASHCEMEAHAQYGNVRKMLQNKVDLNLVSVPSTSLVEIVAKNNHTVTAYADTRIAGGGGSSF